MSHKPVLLKEIIALLDPQPGEFFIDGTIGSGGHAEEILKRIGANGKLLGSDWDAERIENCKLKIGNYQNAILVQGNYANLPEILKEKKFGKADGLLLDLGFSSDQIEESGKGFSFMKDEPLDMRYDHEAWSMEHETGNIEHGAGNMERETWNREHGISMTAAEVINSFSEKDLADIFWKYGEERASRKIAKAIAEARRKEKIITTFQLVRIIEKVLPRRGRLHPATKVFQALRIYVNQEFENLENALKNIDKTIKNQGRIAIISFHSLEDRIVKNRFRELEKQGKAKILTKKPIVATKEEIQTNPRSRSAKVRAIIMNH